LSGVRRAVGVGVALVVVFLGAPVTGGCVRPVTPEGGAAATGANPAADRMGALVGIPRESDVPSGGVVPNLAPVLEAARLAAADTEAGSLRTAARAYLADHPAATRLTSDDLTPSYVSAPTKARYYLGLPSGSITRVDAVSGGWADMVFSLSQQKWGKGTPDNDRAADQDVP
jgi:hypothetical protein